MAIGRTALGFVTVGAAGAFVAVLVARAQRRALASSKQARAMEGSKPRLALANLLESSGPDSEQDTGWIEPESAELPVGGSADESYGGRLSRTRLPQPETTGAVLLDDSPSRLSRDGNDEPMFDIDDDLADDDDLIDDDELTARPDETLPRAMSGDDLDAIAPDDLGLTFLSRATGNDSEQDEPDELFELSNVAMPDESLAGEASLAATQLPIDGSERQPESPFEDDDELDDATARSRALEAELTDIFKPPASRRQARR